MPNLECNVDKLLLIDQDTSIFEFFIKKFIFLTFRVMDTYCGELSRPFHFDPLIKIITNYFCFLLRLITFLDAK